MRMARPVLIVVLAAALLLVLSACDGNRITYVAEDADYDRAAALKLLDEADAGDLASRPTEESAGLREAALTDLRGQRDGAAEAASLITRTLPPTSRSVPFYVETASYEGTPAVVILEAVGPSSGVLRDKRLWVLALDGSVLLAGSR